MLYLPQLRHIDGHYYGMLSDRYFSTVLYKLTRAHDPVDDTAIFAVDSPSRAR